MIPVFQNERALVAAPHPATMPQTVLLHTVLPQTVLQSGGIAAGEFFQGGQGGSGLPLQDGQVDPSRDFAEMLDLAWGEDPDADATAMTAQPAMPWAFAAVPPMPVLAPAASQASPVTGPPAPPEMPAKTTVLAQSIRSDPALNGPVADDSPGPVPAGAAGPAMISAEPAKMRDSGEPPEQAGALLPASAPVASAAAGSGAAYLPDQGGGQSAIVLPTQAADESADRSDLAGAGPTDPHADLRADSHAGPAAAAHSARPLPPPAESGALPSLGGAKIQPAEPLPEETGAVPEAHRMGPGNQTGSAAEVTIAPPGRSGTVSSSPAVAYVGGGVPRGADRLELSERVSSVPAVAASVAWRLAETVEVSAEPSLPLQRELTASVAVAPPSPPSGVAPADMGRDAETGLGPEQQPSGLSRGPEADAVPLASSAFLPLAQHISRQVPDRSTVPLAVTSADHAAAFPAAPNHPASAPLRPVIAAPLPSTARAIVERAAATGGEAVPLPGAALVPSGRKGDPSAPFQPVSPIGDHALARTIAAVATELPGNLVVHVTQLQTRAVAPDAPGLRDRIGSRPETATAAVPDRGQAARALPIDPLSARSFPAVVWGSATQSIIPPVAGPQPSLTKAAARSDSLALAPSPPPTQIAGHSATVSGKAAVVVRAMPPVLSALPPPKPDAAVQVAPARLDRMAAADMPISPPEVLNASGAQGRARSTEVLRPDRGGIAKDGRGDQAVLARTSPAATQPERATRSVPAGDAQLGAGLRVPVSLPAILTAAAAAADPPPAAPPPAAKPPTLPTTAFTSAASTSPATTQPAAKNAQAGDAQRYSAAGIRAARRTTLSRADAVPTVRPPVAAPPAASPGAATQPVAFAPVATQSVATPSVAPKFGAIQPESWQPKAPQPDAAPMQGARLPEAVLPEAPMPEVQPPASPPPVTPTASPALGGDPAFAIRVEMAVRSDQPESAAQMTGTLPPGTDAGSEAIGPADASVSVRQDSSGRIEVFLDPEELGRVRVEMTASGDRMLIHLAAERPESLDLLRRHGDQLLQEFRQAGISGGTLSFGTWGQGDQHQRPPPNAAPPPSPTPPFTPEPLPSLATQLRAQATGSGLNLRL